MKPKVSVLTVTYNHEPFIEKAVRSVLLQQTSFDIEHLIGDDCSTDGTRAILEQLVSENHLNLNVRSRERNMGATYNFRDLYHRGKGEYIALLEGDDYWTDYSKLQRQVEIMDARPDCSLCFHPAEYVDVSGEPVGKRHPAFSMSELTVDDIVPSNPIQTCSILLRRASLPKLPEFLTTLKLGDWPICILAARQGPILFLDRCMSAYRLHNGGTWSSDSLRNRKLATADMYLELAIHYPELVPLCRSALLNVLRVSLDQTESAHLECESIRSSWTWRTGQSALLPFKILSECWHLLLNRLDRKKRGIRLQVPDRRAATAGQLGDDVQIQ